MFPGDARSREPSLTDDAGVESNKTPDSLSDQTNPGFCWVFFLHFQPLIEQK